MSSTKSNSCQQTTLGEAFLFFGQQEDVTDVSLMRNVFQAPTSSYVQRRQRRGARGLGELELLLSLMKPAGPSLTALPKWQSQACLLLAVVWAGCSHAAEVHPFWEWPAMAPQVVNTHLYLLPLCGTRCVRVTPQIHTSATCPALQGIIRKDRMNPRCWRNVAALRGSQLGQINPKVSAFVGHLKVSEFICVDVVTHFNLIYFFPSPSLEITFSWNNHDTILNWRLKPSCNVRNFSILSAFLLKSSPAPRMQVKNAGTNLAVLVKEVFFVQKL